MNFSSNHLSQALYFQIVIEDGVENYLLQINYKILSYFLGTTN